MRVAYELFVSCYLAAFGGGAVFCVAAFGIIAEFLPRIDRELLVRVFFVLIR